MNRTFGSSVTVSISDEESYYKQGLTKNQSESSEAKQMPANDDDVWQSRKVVSLIIE